MVAVIPTSPYHGYSVLFSPFSPGRIAFVGGLNYGIAGTGALIIFDHSPQGFKELQRYLWEDGLFDVTWSELHEPILVAAAGNGQVLLFNHTHPEGPTAILSGHSAEVSSVEWSISRKEQFILSGSWDKTIKIWDPEIGQCISTLTGHTGLVYSTNWSPQLPQTIASVSGDGCLRLWDITSPPKCTAYLNVGCGELLACNWNKYHENILCTAGVDTTLRLWDIRQLSLPVLVMSGHTQSIKQIKFDPHSPSLLASCSYDFTVRLWNTDNPVSPLFQTIHHHKEFTYSVDFSLHEKGLMADCSWDKTIKLYRPSSLTTPPTISLTS